MAPDPSIFIIDLLDANKKPVLRILIRKDPKLLAGSGYHPEPK
jgi:hypothetical protein